MPQAPEARAMAKQATRAALISAAMAEFAESGLDTPSLDAICARAGYTRGAFYVHFKDRDELMIAVMEFVLGSFIDALIAAGDGAHDLEHTIARFADAVAAVQSGRGDGLPLPANVPLARVLEATVRSPRLRQTFVRLLEQACERLAVTAVTGQGAGTVRADVDAKTLALMLVATALGVAVAIDVGLPLDPGKSRDAVQHLIRQP